MRREFTATVDREEIAIVCEHVGAASWRVTVDGEVQDVDAREIRPGTWSLLIGGRSAVVDVERGKRGVTLMTGVLEVAVQLEDARRRKLARAVSGRAAGQRAGEIITAPIAGKVVTIEVAVGDEVEPGQTVAVLEAMKMENEIKAERGGAVTEVHVSAGQSVESGDRLVSLG